MEHATGCSGARRATTAVRELRRGCNKVSPMLQWSTVMAAMKLRRPRRRCGIDAFVCLELPCPWLQWTSTLVLSVLHVGAPGAPPGLRCNERMQAMQRPVMALRDILQRSPMVLALRGRICHGRCCVAPMEKDTGRRHELGLC
ncbi:hypothetical protein ZWY2020_035274 [Hordeum vulgare]|nr:hypothetical protein ZWY2020_035274 [Hordeum vulgare]